MPPTVPAPATPGTVSYVPFARFTYNALGHRTSAVYDLHRPEPPASPQADPFADETIEWLVYDPSWRVVATYLQFPPAQGQTTRPQPKLHERYVYHMLDAPILRQRDTNGDGRLTAADQTIHSMQNVRGDVVGVAAGDGKLLEFVHYTAHGWPTVIPRSIADIVSIGGFPPWDGNLTVDDYTSFIEAFIEGSLLADITSIGGLGMPDGEVTVDEDTAFINAFAEDSALGVTQGVLSAPTGSLPRSPSHQNGTHQRSMKPATVVQQAIREGTPRPNRLGGTDYVMPDGRGVRFNGDGSLRGFLEPTNRGK